MRVLLVDLKTYCDWFARMAALPAWRDTAPAPVGQAV